MMIEVIPTGLDDRVLGVRVTGPIERGDLDAVAAAFEEKLRRHKRLRIYAEIVDMGKVTPSALLEDLRLSMRHFRDVEREAIVADAGWLALLARAGNLVPGIEVRCFSWLDKGKALEWINVSPGAGPK
jgi:hypothetical protein